MKLCTAINSNLVRGPSSITTETAKKMRNMRVFRLIFLVVSLGWLMVWIMLPTKLYKNTWTPKLNDKLNSTYFAGQGTNLLLFSFPVMFIAALGCVYLHLQKKPGKPNSKSAVTSNRLSFLRRPALVMAPLGIVTAIELAFVAMFIALLIWSLANYLYVSFGHLHMHKEVEKVWEAKFRSVSLRLGYIGNICWAFLFFPVTRGSSILPLVGLTSESSIKYHIWLGHLSMILFAAHTVGFIIYWGMTNQMALVLEITANHIISNRLSWSILCGLQLLCFYFLSYDPDCFVLGIFLKGVEFLQLFVRLELSHLPFFLDTNPVVFLVGQK